MNDKQRRVLVVVAAVAVLMLIVVPWGQPGTYGNVGNIHYAPFWVHDGSTVSTTTSDRSSELFSPSHTKTTSQYVSDVIDTSRLMLQYVILAVCWAAAHFWFADRKKVADPGS